MSSGIWEPGKPLVDWFDNHPVIAALVALFLPGIPQILMGHYLVGAIFIVAACIAWPFLMGWLVHVIAAVHAYDACPKEGEDG